MPIPEPSPMSIAIDRAMKAAETDPLIEAVELAITLRRYVDAILSDDQYAMADTRFRDILDRADCILAKYQPQS